FGRRFSRHRIGAAFRHADRFHCACSSGRRAGLRQPGVRLLPGLPDLLPAREARARPSVRPQLWALAVAGAVVLAGAGLETFRGGRARRLSAAATAAPSSDPYILYFTG